jgi:hypothetical protein
LLLTHVPKLFFYEFIKFGSKLSTKSKRTFLNYEYSR